MKVEIGDDNATLTGPKGTLKVSRLSNVKVSMAEGKMTLEPQGTSKQSRMNWGTLWSHLSNAIEGVTKGFTKILEIEGIGFKASLEGNTLVLKVGFSHPVKFSIPEDITASIDKNTITISGIDKQRVGHVAATIRKVKKPEPYLGKGIHYQGEVIRKKEGKKAAAATATAAK